MAIGLSVALVEVIAGTLAPRGSTTKRQPDHAQDLLTGQRYLCASNSFSFGSIHVEGVKHENDVLIDRRKVHQRKEKSSKSSTTPSAFHRRGKYRGSAGDL